MKEELKELENEVEEIKDNGIAFELLADYKKQNKRQFIIIIVILIMWFATIGYLVYLLNDIGTSEETIDIEDVETIDKSNIQVGDGDTIWGE